MPVKVALNGPILLVAIVENSVSEFFLNFSHPGIVFFNISGSFNASQTFCFSKLIWYDPLSFLNIYKYILIYMDDNTKKELQSAAFDRLLNHLRKRKDVQNIDLMNLAGFCRNCLSKWYREEAEKKGIEISDPDAREHVYGMPYSEWKEKYIK